MVAHCWCTPPDCSWYHGSPVPITKQIATVWQASEIGQEQLAAVTELERRRRSGLEMAL
jgi:hypothetical protein